MRFVHLSADPPDTLSFDSCGEYGDPGNYAFNARNKVVTGEWRMKELGAAAFSPIPHIVTYLSFKVFGTGIWQMNLVPLLFSALLLIALYILASKFFPEARLLFFLLLTLNYPFGIFSRVNDQVIPMTFFVIPAIYFFLKAWDRPSYFFLTSVFLGLSFLSKSKMIYFHAGVIPLAFLLIAIQRHELRNIRLLLVRIGYFMSGVLLVAIPWYVFIYSRYPNIFRNVATLNTTAALPENIGQVLSNWVRKPAFSFYPTNRLLTFVLFFYFLAVLIAFFNKKSKVKITSLEIICSLWLLIGLGVNSFIGYRPIRHYIEFTIPIVILVSLFLVRLPAGWRLDFALKRRGLFFAAFFVLVWIGLSSFSRKFFPIEDWDNRTDKIFFMSGLLFLAVAALLFALLILFNKGLSAKGLSVSKTFGLLVMAVFTAIYACQNSEAYVRWAKNPTFNLKTIGRDLGKAFPQGVFSGLLVPSLSLENRNKAHTFFPNYANDDPGFLKREGVTHLFLGEFNSEAAPYERTFPEEMGHARLLVRYRLWRSWFFLYDIRDGPSTPDDPAVHEAEIMQRQTGLPLFDPQAGGRFAVRVESGEPKIIGYEKIVLPGQRKFRGRLFVKPESGDLQSLALLVKLTKRGIVLYEKKMGVPREAQNGGYQALAFDGFLPSEGRYVLEIKAFGKGVFYFDKLEIRTEGDAPQ